VEEDEGDAAPERILSGSSYCGCLSYREGLWSLFLLAELSGLQRRLSAIMVAYSDSGLIWGSGSDRAVVRYGRFANKQMAEAGDTAGQRGQCGCCVAVELGNVRMVVVKGEATAIKFYILWDRKRKRGIGIRDISEILEFPFNPFKLVKHCRCSPSPRRSDVRPGQQPRQVTWKPAKHAWT
jgi:hypothetical protein